VVAGLDDEHYRPAEMCLKVSAKHDVAGSGPGAARRTRHELPRVRATAVRTLGVVGDTEHAEDVLAVLHDPEEWVREHAARAYARMARRLDLPPLEAVE
jgi:HEAT repeat protein